MRMKQTYIWCYLLILPSTIQTSHSFLLFRHSTQTPHILLNLLAWYWFTKPHSFQVYKSKKIICTFHCVLTTPSKVSFHPLSSHIYPPLPAAYPPFSLDIIISLSIYVLHTYIYCLIPSPSFTQPPTAFPFDSCKSVPCTPYILIPFCYSLTAEVPHMTPHITI